MLYQIKHNIIHEMKNILICGAARSGKSTLARVLKSEFDYNIFEIDVLRIVYNSLFPELNIRKQELSVQNKILFPMLVEFIKGLCWGNKWGQYYIVEGDNIDLENILSKFPDFIVICMGYTKISTKEKVNEISKYETEKDWTYGDNTNKKEHYCERFIKQSQVLKETAEKLNIPFFDTSYDRNKIIEEILLYVKKELN